ncbi:OLC1v1011513C1 [Oldenlandia corymbosa var. corymbosa]|uniref:OLC1v1011513C1 n=1 Tax=Oldenlandia corymbosa var. corymbosa TaxID=529605 RepID=A0AAV1DTS4_OLDCO|nr:OLC1v1011513C1 [Oldenlandia corymbosa var. corymbosa]
MTDKSENRGAPQMDKKEEGKLEGLPVGTSPYTQYKDLEDYKQQGYGAQGHLQPQPGRGAAGSVDAPTEAGAKATPAAQLSSTDVINKQGVS